MLKSMKWGLVAALVTTLAAAAGDEHCRPVVCGRALEGLAGGLLFGLALALSKAERVRPGSFPIPRAARVVLREAAPGLVGGLLTGVALVLVNLAKG